MSAAQARALQVRIVNLARRVEELDIGSYEKAEAARLRDELLPRVTGHVQQAVALFDVVLDCYEPVGSEESEPGADFYQQLDHLLADSGPPPVADLAFIARSELMRKLAALSSLGEAHGWRLIDVCGSGLRRIRKGLAAVEAALCEQEGLDPVLGYAGELASSLAVRRTYAKFRQEVLRSGQTSRSIADCLHSGATSIAKLIGRDLYGDLRICDRVQIRQLQERTVDWLRAGPDRDVLTGLRLWQDLCGFANLLADVNKRQELAEHDRAAVAEARRLLASSPPVLPAELHPVLDVLFGRDDELDDLLLRDGELSCAELEPILARLGESLLTPVLPPREPESAEDVELEESETV